MTLSSRPGVRSAARVSLLLVCLVALAPPVSTLEAAATALPPPLPPPPPAQAPFPTSPDGTFGATVTDAQGGVWTKGPEGHFGNAGSFLVQRNGQPVPSPFGPGFGDAYAANLLWFGGQVYGVNSGGIWFTLYADRYGSTISGDPRIAPQPAPPVGVGGGTAIPAPPARPSPNASPHGTVVEGAGVKVTDYFGKVWALRDRDTPDDYKGSGGEQGGAMFVGYAVSEDGIYDPDPPHAIKLAVFHTPEPTIWMRDNIGFWYRGVLSGGPDPNWTFAEDPFVPPVPRPEPRVGTRTLKGGWRFPAGHGNLAMRYDGVRPVKAWLSSKFENPGDVLEFDLPPMGTGSDPNQWPMLTPTRTIPAWWVTAVTNDPTLVAARAADPAKYALTPFKSYANGLFFGSLNRGAAKLWAAPFTNYAQDAEASLPTLLVAADGETITVPIPRQRFAGFVKRGPGLEPYIGAGGYASGQGTSAGPTLARLDGTRIIEYDGQRHESPGPGLEFWNSRAPREPNYEPVWKIDQWVAWNVRNGEGRWASDRIWAGGLVLPEGISYWPRLATGVVYYRLQNLTFGAPAADRTYRYLYSPSTFQFDRYELTGIGEVRGQEVGPDGSVYLATQTFFSGEPVIVSVFGN